MNAVILEPAIETWLSSLAPTTLVLNTDTTVGWKTELERLALGARRREELFGKRMQITILSDDDFSETRFMDAMCALWQGVLENG